MYIPKLSSEELNSNELRDFIGDSFLNWNENNWYRWFSRQNITLDYKKRELIFHLDKEQSNWWPQNFNDRVNVDSTFNGNDFWFIPGFEFEQKMFDGTITTEELDKAVRHIRPEIWWKIAITETSMYLDESWEIFIAIPLAIPDETYGLSGKLSWSYLHTGESLLKTWNARKLIDPREWKREWNTLFDLQRQYSNHKIIEKIDEFKFWEWSVKIVKPNGGFSKMDNVHIWRANDGAFEILSSHLFRSYEDLVSNYHIKENLWFNRPVSLVKVSDLLDCDDGSPLPVQKLFYDNECISTEDLPEIYMDSITQDAGWEISIWSFQRTPPLRIFEWKLKTLLLTDEFRSTTQSLIESSRNRNLTTDLNRIWEQFEDDFSKKFNLSKNTQTFNFDIKIPENFSEIIEANKWLTSDEKSSLIWYIWEKNWTQDTVLNLSPDFMLEIDKWKIFIEYKSGKWALKKSQSKEQSIRAALIQIFWEQELNYNIIVWGDYGINDMDLYGWYIRKISETYLASETGENIDELVDFLT